MTSTPAKIFAVSRNAGQAGRQHVCAKVFKVQVDVILFRADTAAFADFHCHRARDNIAGCEVLGGRGVAFHEAFAFGIGQIPAFAARAFGDQAAGAIDAGRVELDKFHVLQRQAGAQHHRIAIACTGVGRRTGEESAAIAAGRQNNLLRAEAVQCAVIQFPGGHTAAGAFLIHDQVEREILDEELGLFLDALTVQCVQHGVAGRSAAAQVRCTGPLPNSRVMPPKAR